MPQKGPYDYIDDLRRRKTQLEKDISAGKSGDGYTKPDLKAQLNRVNGELNNMLRSNPEKMTPNERAKRLYPKSNHK